MELEQQKSPGGAVAGAAPPPQARAPALAKLAELDERLAVLRAAAGVPPAEVGRALTAVEEELFALLPRLIELEPTLAAERAHLALAASVEWREELAAAGLALEAQACGELHDALVRDEAQRWIAQADALRADADVLVEHLARASLLEREALLRRDTPAGAGRVLVSARAPARAALVARVAAHEPDAGRRRSWAGALVDRANEVLTAIDDLPPGEAVEQLDVVIDDLAWHARALEPVMCQRSRRLRAKLARLRAEREERVLQERVERLFGQRLVALWEQLVVALIFLVLGLMAAEATLELTPGTLYWMSWSDAAACAVFLWDFGVKWALVRGSLGWLRRHFLIDLLPSIPYALLLQHASLLDRVRGVRGLRLLRLTRVARYMRALLPAIRVVRAFGFLARGLDRVVRGHGHLLNRNIVVHPTPAERRAFALERESPWPRLWRVRAELSHAFAICLREAAAGQREAVAAARSDGLCRVRAAGLARRLEGQSSARPAAAQLCADDLLRRLQDITPEEIDGEMGPDFTARAARAVRTLARAPMRWLPILRAWIPRLAPELGDGEVVARAAQHVAARFHRSFARLRWFADLYGTVTPSELVDRIGSTLVKRTARPAYRLLIFGGIYLFVQVLLRVIGLDALAGLARVLQSLVGTALVVLGSVCLVLLGLGWWMQRIASAATAFYEQIARAQYLHLTESIKTRFLERDAEIFERRLFAAEAELAGACGRAPAAGRQRAFIDALQRSLAHGRGERGLDSAAMRTVALLYRDALDGAILAESDTRTSGQLLGNLALKHMREASWRVGKAELKELEALDLDRQRTVFRGPYLWFSFICKAIAQGSARLIVDYNQNAVPLDELAQASPAARARYERWLASRAGRAVEPEAPAKGAQSEFVSTDFTALHILDDDPARDEEVRRRFGEPVYDNLRRDRRRLFRRIFGTYPLHLLPQDERILNLRRTYERWLEGGRALFLPFLLARRALAQVGVALRFVARAVGEIQAPKLWSGSEEEAQSDFTPALRKIERMRAPGAFACLWQRALFDVEYLGVRLPGAASTGLEGADVDVDLAYLDADPRWVRRVRDERHRAEADVRSLGRLIEEGLFERARAALGSELPLGREHVRAALLAYHSDYRGVRSLLSAREILAETLREAARGAARGPLLLPRLRLARAHRHYWKEVGAADQHLRRAAWRATVADYGGAAGALLQWAELGDEGARARGEAILFELLRHPARLSEQLVTLRAVQTLSLIDVLNYRSHVWRLGGFGDDGGDSPRGLELPLGREPARG